MKQFETSTRRGSVLPTGNFITMLMLLLLAIIVPVSAMADDDKKTDKSKLRITGRVKDAASRKDLVKAKVTITDSLGNVVDTLRTGGWITYTSGSNNYLEQAKFSFSVPRRPGVYTIEVNMPDYQDTYYTYKVEKIGRREYDRDMPDIYMQAAPRELGEVVVTTSKVKFYHKGDTIVFNADAFELAEGSMLDALIKQLPGVELKEGGQIYVNGEFVENLLLNGKDFFKGKNELMLDNLGAYTVKNVEVYKRSPELQEWAGDKSKQELVMDVKLKKEYNMGWIVNLEGGIGTSDRYMGRAFINRFTVNSRLSLIGNVNNLNDNRKPGESSTWTPETNTAGTMVTQLGGLDYYAQEADEKWKVNGDATVRHTSQTDHRETSRINFLGSDRTYHYDYLNNKTKSLSLSTSHRITLKPRKSVYLGALADGSYSRTRSEMTDIGGAFREDQPTMDAEVLEGLYSGGESAMQDVINRSRIKTRSSGHNAGGSVRVSGGWEVPHTSDYLYFGVRAFISSNKNEAWRDYIVNYGADPVPAIHQNRYFDNSPNRSVTLMGDLSYQVTLNDHTRITLGYGYEHSDKRSDSYAYALDRLEEQGVFGSLPEGYLSTLDASQSYRSHTVDNTNIAQLCLSFWSDKLSIYLDPSVKFHHRNFDYFRNGTDHHVDQNNIVVSLSQFSGGFYLKLAPYMRDGKYKVFRHRISWLPSITPTLPDPVKMVDIVDDNDPLNIWTGNRELKPSYNFKNFLQWFLTAPIGTYTFNNMVEFVYSYTRDELVNGYRYNSDTGVRIHRTYNVPSGNTSTNFHIRPSLQFGSKGQFTATYFAGLDFIRSADMIGYDADPVKSQVHTYWMVQKLDFSWQIGKQQLGLRGEVNSRRTASDAPDFKTITGTQSFISANGKFSLPKGFGISTDFTVFIRRGYGSPDLDTTQPVMNMRLSYAPPKSKFVFMLDGFDLFHQLSNVQYTVNSQGRTVVVNNVLPRYLMFHVQYKLNIQPKKKIIDNTYHFDR